MGLAVQANALRAKAQERCHREAEPKDLFLGCNLQLFFLAIFYSGYAHPVRQYCPGQP
jgi:hypothetical protein